MERFIVGTGRCGSTLLSRMLGERSDVSSVFEFFNGLDVATRFSTAPVDGRAFAELISAEQPVVTAVLRRGYEVSEITYPFGAGGRFGRGDPLPWILVSALPRLDADPDALFDATRAWASAQPRRPLVEHYRALFGWWAERAGRRHWIERSGSSIDYLESLGRLFPAARFAHIHRDGPEAALSMREHHAYRLPIAMMYAPPGTADARITPDALRADPDPDDAVSRILASRPPVAYYGRYWSDQVIRGARALRILDASQYCEVRFEDLIASPREVLARLADFFELGPASAGWLDRAAGLVRGTPATRFDQLPDPEREVLAAECRPGRLLLGRSA